MSFSNLNLPAVLVAVIVALVLSGILHLVRPFKTMWLKCLNADSNKINAKYQNTNITLTMIITLLSTAIYVLIVGIIIAVMDLDTFGQILFTAMLIAIIIGLVNVRSALFTGSVKLALIEFLFILIELYGVAFVYFLIHWY